MATDSIDNQLERTIEKQMQVVKQAYSTMKDQLHKYGLTMMPTKTDPDTRAQAFLRDSEAIEARLSYRREQAALERLKHPEYYQESHKRDYYKNREARLATTDRWRRDHLEKYVDWASKWLHRHPEKDAEIRHRRRAKLANVVSTFTQDDYEFLFTIQEGRCAYCNKPAGWGDTETRLVAEHMTPIDKGGDNTLYNIVLACHGKGSCNSSKQRKTVEEYLKYLEAVKGTEERKLVETRLEEVLDKLEALLIVTDSSLYPQS